MLLLAAIVVLAAALRLPTIAKYEMWADECHSVIVAVSPRGIMAELREDTNAPLYFAVLKVWIAAWGPGELAVRSLSALMGLLFVAMLCGAARELRLPGAAGLWAALAAGLAPIMVFYSQEARGYALLHVLALAAAWTLARAMQRRGWRPWLAHSACVVLLLYTHNLAASLLPALWLAAALAPCSRRPWRGLAAAHGAAVLLWAPWLVRVAGQARVPGLEWISDLTGPWSLVMALPASIEAFGIGGDLPAYIRAASPGGAWRAVSLVLTFGALLGLLLPCPAGMDVHEDTPSRGSHWVPGLLALLFVPLLVQAAFSAAVRPVYVPARYDTVAAPAFLLLLGAGMDRVTRAAALRNPRGRTAATAALLAIVLLLALRSLAPNYAPLPNGVVHHPQDARGEVLKAQAGAADLLVCLGLEGGKIAYQVIKRDIPADMLTFPRSTQRHPGWFNPRESLKAPAELQRDADDVAGRLLRDATPYRRMWVFMDPYSGRGDGNDYDRVSRILLETLASHGLREVDPPAVPGVPVERLGIRIFEAPLTSIREKQT